MDMICTVNELKKTMDVSMERLKNKLKDEVFEDNLEPEAIELAKDLFHMCDLAMKLVEQQAIMIQGMDAKLDALLATK